MRSEGLAALGTGRNDLEDVETDSLGERAALANGNDITDLDTEGWGAVSGDSLMALLESVILLDVMKVIASDDDCS